MIFDEHHGDQREMEVDLQESDTATFNITDKIDNTVTGIILDKGQALELARGLYDWLGLY